MSSTYLAPHAINFFSQINYFTLFRILLKLYLEFDPVRRNLTQDKLNIGGRLRQCVMELIFSVSYIPNRRFPLLVVKKNKDEKKEITRSELPVEFNKGNILCYNSYCFVLYWIVDVQRRFFRGFFSSGARIYI